MLIPEEIPVTQVTPVEGCKGRRALEELSKTWCVSRPVTQISSGAELRSRQVLRGACRSLKGVRKALVIKIKRVRKTRQREAKELPVKRKV